ncbi:MAG: epoxyqueuosine reductase [Desulfuromonadales bacterium]
MEDRIRTEIIRFITGHPGNCLPDSNSSYFGQPLVGFSAASDPLFADYKSIIGPFHLLPGELLPEAASVISWILPVSTQVRDSNHRQKELPSREWALTRTHGEAINGDLRRHLVAWLEDKEYRGVAPQYSPLWKEFGDTPVGIASAWSERHAAYAAGLGTFSLSDGLITPVGIAHRCGSVITNLVLVPTPRTAPDHLHNCLYHRNGNCGACITRCPVGAISRAGHDKARCRELVYGEAPRQLSELYGVPQTGCGLCQTAVPCEGGIP